MKDKMKKELTTREGIKYLINELYIAGSMLAGYGIGYLTKTYDLLPKEMSVEQAEIAGMVVGGLAALTCRIYSERKRRKKQSELESKIQKPTQ